MITTDTHTGRGEGGREGEREGGREGGRKGGSPLVSAEMECIPSTGWWQCQTKDHIAVGASQALAWFTVPHQGAHPMAA